MEPISAGPAFAGLLDADVVRGVVADDRAALVVMMRRYDHMMFRTARAILGDDAEAEDAVQEAHLIAHRSLIGFRGEAKLSTWLVRIVANEALGRLRRRKRRARVIRSFGDLGRTEQAMVMNIADQKSEQPETEALRCEARRLLERAIDGLPDAFRAVFMLRAVDEMTVEETSAMLDIPGGTVRTRYFRARSLLRRRLGSMMTGTTAR